MTNFVSPPKGMSKTYEVRRHVMGERDFKKLPLLGWATQYRSGWKFYATARHGGRQSRKYHPTFEASLPRWTGGLDGTQSEEA